MRTLKKIPKNVGKLFVILRVFVSSWWVWPGVYHEDAKNRQVLVAAGQHRVHLWFHFPTVYAMSAALYACRLCYFLGYRRVRSNGITMSPLTDNPFAVLTAVVAPAILTNASSVLCLGTGNRMARVVDRTRVIAAELASLEGGSSEYQVRVRQLERLQLRAQLLLKALRTFYASLGSFAAAALISVVGSALAFYDLRVAFRAAAVVGFAVGVFAVAGLVSGCALMVRETRLAVQTLTEEADLARARYRSVNPIDD